MKKVIQFIKKHRSLLFSLATIIVVSTSFFIYSYFRDGSQPDVVNKGYYLWYDQSQYMVMAKDLSQFKLDKMPYGIGYPILGALFYNVYPVDPFVIPNLIIYVASIILLFFTAKLFYKTDTIPLLLVFVFQFTSSIVTYVYTPWNSTVNLLAFSILLYIVLSRKVRIRYMIVIAAMFAWIFSARYIDIFFIAPLIAYWFWQDGDWKNFLRKGIQFSLLAFLLIMPVLYAHEVKFGSPFKTPYSTHMREDGYSDQDVQRYDLSSVDDSWFSLLVGTLTPEDHIFPPLFKSAPLFYLFPLLFVGLWKTKSKALLFAVLGMFLAFIFYGTFPAFNGAHIKYGCVHYIKMWFPLLSLLIVLGLSSQKDLKKI